MAGAERERTGRETETTVTNRVAYHKPLTAILRGRTVKILVTGDVPGHSPMCQFVDENGRLGWDEEDRFRIIDTEFLPPNRDTLHEVLQSIR